MEGETLSHQEILSVTSGVLNEVLKNDAYLSELPRNVTLHEINNKIQLLHGNSITVKVYRDDQTLSVIVPQSGCRVYELKRAIKRCIELEQERGEGPGSKKISWKYVWRRYKLQQADGRLLDDDQADISSYGIVHKSHLSFVKTRRKR